jgi:hypothetical protein
LGVLQGLARRRLLETLDYVSAVSGGGYTGGRLSAWLFHAGRNGRSPKEVCDALAGTTGSNVEPEAKPIPRIREYSNQIRSQNRLPVDRCLVAHRDGRKKPAAQLARALVGDERKGRARRGDAGSGLKTVAAFSR